MITARNCDYCGKMYQARTVKSQFCSTSCRARHSESLPKEVQRQIVSDIELGGVLKTTRAQLEAARRVDTPEGQVALLLAARLDANVRESGMGVAAIVREHSRCLAEALKGAQVAADPVDELRDRRDNRRVG